MSRFHTDLKRHAAKKRDHGVLTWALALVAGAIAFVSSFLYFDVTGVLEQINAQDPTPLLGPAYDRPTPPTDTVEGQWINILLMGSDTRVGANAGIGGETGGLATEMNNDTTILMHISADRTRIELVSFPRDSVVQLPGCEYSDGSKATYRETARFNRSFYIGGMHGNVGDAAACTIKTVESLTGIYISEYIVVDFVGVETIINILEGVPMCIPFDVSSPKAGLKLKAGPHTLTGWEALAWARARTLEFPDSATRRAFEQYYGAGNGNDLGRIKRQQELISGVFEVLVEGNTLLNPAKMTSLLEAAAGSMTVSPNFKQLDFLLGLGYSIRGVDKTNIVFTTVPTITNPADRNTLVFSTTKANALFAAIAADKPIEGDSVADMSTAGPVPTPTTTAGTNDDINPLLAACTAG